MKAFSNTNGSTKVSRKGNKVDVEVMDLDGLFDLYEGPSPQSESELWDLIFAHQYFFNSLTAYGFVEGNHAVAANLLSRYASVCPSTTNQAAGGRCVFNYLRKKNKIRIASGRYDEGMRCLSWSDRPSSQKADCKEY